MDNSSVKIRDENGKEIGSIICPQKWPDIIIPEEFGRNNFGFMTTTHKRRVWKDPEAIILWAWWQVINAHDQIWDLLQGRSDKSLLCMTCGKNSIIFKRTLLIRDKWRGIVCNNPDCSMYNILIPSRLFYRNPPKNILDKLGVRIK